MYHYLTQGSLGRKGDTRNTRPPVSPYLGSGWEMAKQSIHSKPPCLSLLRLPRPAGTPATYVRVMRAAGMKGLRGRGLPNNLVKN